MEKKRRDPILFSIHIPVYRTEQSLSKCVESVLNQTYTNFELFLMDDGSPDNCPGLCDDYEKRDSRVHALHQKNQGLLMARRNSLKHATGDYCLFVDSDDWVSPDWLEKIYKEIIEHNADLVLFDWNIINNVGQVQYDSIDLKPNLVYGENADKSDVFRLFLTGNSINSLALKAIKTELVGKYCSYDAFQGMQQDEDVLQSMLPLEKAQRIAYIHEPLYHYRQNGDGICHNNSIKRFREICRSLDEKKFYGERLGELQKVEKEFCNYSFRILCGLYVEMEKSTFPTKERKIVCDLIRNSECYKVYANKAVSYADTVKDKLKFFLLYAKCDHLLFALARIKLNSKR